MSTAATIAQTAVAVPEHRLAQQEVKRALRELLPERADTLLSLLDAAGVASRYSVLPLEDIHRRRSLGETMALYREHAVRLGRQVATACLAEADVPARAVDLVISVSCTGFMLPSFDAYLANDLGMRPDVRRLPITELGCLGGAAALAHAADFVAGHPDATVLVVAVELPTLSFQREDLSPANLVSTALFGDGAAAALVTGRRRPGAGIVATQSHLFPRSYDALGFDLKEDGLHVVLARELPALLRAEVPRLVKRLLADGGFTRADLRAFVLHPGGPRILEALQEELGLSADDLAPSWRVLRDYGNPSSAAVLFVLDEWLRRRPPAGTGGLLGAFGPGLSSQLLLLRWT